MCVRFWSEQGFAKPVLEVGAVAWRQDQRKLVGGDLDLREQRTFGSMDVSPILNVDVIESLGGSESQVVVTWCSSFPEISNREGS